MARTYDMTSTSFTEEVNKRNNEFREGIYSGLPAIIVGVSDYENFQCVDVELSINDIYTRKDAAILGSITLHKRFVKLPRFGGWKFRLPVAKGDPVTLQWAHKDIDKWLDGLGENVDQPVTEIAGINDCWVELGFGTRKNHNDPHLKNLEIEGPSTKMTITPEGNITTTTSGNINCTAEGTYDITASHLTIHNDTTITENLTVNGNTVLEGTLGIGGETTAQGTVNALAGTFSSTYAGVGGGAASFDVDMGINGVVTINGIVINTHVHPVIAEGQPTGGPQ